MNIIVRADASAKIGSGHVMRCLTLAEACRKRGARVSFICREHPGNLAPLIAGRGFPVSMLAAANMSAREVPHSAEDWLGGSPAEDMRETRRVVSEQNEVCDWLIVDQYGIDARWEEQLRGKVSRIMVIDDLADRPHYCDLLLDQNFRPSHDGRYDGLVPKHCLMAMGPRFALLQHDYAYWRQRVVPRTKVTRILVYFGGVDAAGLTKMAIRAALGTGLAVDAVVSGQDAHLGELERLAADEPRLTLHKGLPSLAPLMAASDLAIGAFGSTSWERLCLGLPSIAVTLAENQQDVADALAAASLALFAGPAAEASERAFETMIGAVIRDKGLSEWSRRCLEVCDGRGTERVVDMLWTPTGIMAHGKRGVAGGQL